MPTTQTLELPMALVQGLEQEAQAQHKPVSQLIAEWLEDLAEDKAVREAIQYNQGKGSMAAADLYRQCGH
jgi:hypothetical protein